MAIVALSFNDDAVSGEREVGSEAGSDRATDGAGLEGGAGGACAAGGEAVDGVGVDGAGLVGAVADCDGTSGSRERSMRGRDAGVAGSAARSAVGVRRISFLDGEVRGTGGRLATLLRAASVGLESTDGGETSRGGAAGSGVELGGGAGFSTRSWRTGGLLLATRLSATSVRIAE